jgi:SPP1 family predicted phage head-tail adaptor
MTAVTIYYRSDVSVSHRLVIEGLILQIQSVQDPTGQREMLRLLCVEAGA